MNPLRRRLFNLATALSALFALAALTMQVRSGYAADVWELPPRPAPHFYAAAQAGWVTHRIIQSSGGFVVWITYDEMEIKLIRQPFHMVLPLALAPGQRGRYDERSPHQLSYFATAHGRIPYVAEWYVFSDGRYVAVPWLLLFLVGSLLPVARWLWSRRRVRAKSGPAFPVLPK